MLYSLGRAAKTCVVLWISFFRILQFDAQASWPCVQFAHFGFAPGASFLLQVCVLCPPAQNPHLVLFLHALATWPNALHLKHWVSLHPASNSSQLLTSPPSTYPSSIILFASSGEATSTIIEEYVLPSAFFGQATRRIFTPGWIVSLSSWA